jgi:hypothetical protein
MTRLVLLLVFLIACGDGSPCDGDQHYSHGLCFELLANPDATPPPTPYAHYGDGCADTTSCAAPTDWCYVQFGASIGYCTHTGCLDDPTLCPEGWRCQDLSVFVPGLPAVCAQP